MVKYHTWGTKGDSPPLLPTSNFSSTAAVCQGFRMGIGAMDGGEAWSTSQQQKHGALCVGDLNWSSNGGLHACKHTQVHTLVHALRWAQVHQHTFLHTNTFTHRLALPP
jgi:hypothetical protein